MANDNKDRFTQSLDDFNPYYAPHYDSQNNNSKNKKSNTKSNNTEGKNLLRRAESSSLTSFGRNQSEPNPSWKTSVQGKPITKGAKFNFKNRKKSIALIAILAMLIGGGTFLSSTHSLLPAAFEALITEATDYQYASNTARSVRLTSYMLQNNNVTSTSWNGLVRYTRMSSTFKANLARNNITIDGSGSNTTLNFKQVNADGTERIIPIKADEFAQVYKDNPEFRNAYTKAKRGRVLGFFDNIADRIATRIGLSRNVFKNSQTTNDTDADTENFNKIMSNQNENSSTTTNSGYIEEKQAYNEDGSPKYTIDENGNRVPVTEPDGIRETAAQSNVKDPTDATVKANSYLSGIISGAQKGTKLANSMCMISKVGNIIAITAAATEIYQAIKIATPFGESISKMKNGYGTSSAINETMAKITTPEESVVEDYSTLEVAADGTSKVETVKTRKAAVENEALLGILSNKPANPASVSNYSFERLGSAISSALVMSVGSMLVCEGVSAANAVVSIAVTIGTLGVSAIGSILLNIGAGAVASIAAQALLGFLIPTLAKVFFTNPWLNATGSALGATIVRGFAAFNSKLATSGSALSPSSENAILAYNKLNNEILAMDAETDRLNHSPFDVTSKNTFLGSIAYNLLPTTLSGSTNAVQTILRTTSKSIASLAGSVNAAGKGTSYSTTFGDCPQLESIGAKGDMFCNIIPTTDSSIIDISPDDTAYKKAIEDQIECEDNGECQIKDSEADCLAGQCELAKYIKYCTERDSPYGVVDTNILSELQALTTGNNVIDSLLNAIPIIGDVIDIITAAGNAANMSWATGENCTNSNQNKDWDSKYKYYQLYVQDMRLLDSIGENEIKNPVTAFLDKYHSEHPIDNSPAGYIARISGIPKTSAEDLIAIVDYYQFLQNYDSSTRIAMTKENTTIQPADTIIAQLENDRLFFSDESESIIIEEFLLAKQSESYIIYADIRNRSFAA